MKQIIRVKNGKIWEEFEEDGEFAAGYEFIFGMTRLARYKENEMY